MLGAESSFIIGIAQTEINRFDIPPATQVFKDFFQHIVARAVIPVPGVITNIFGIEDLLVKIAGPECDGGIVDIEHMG